MFNLTRKVVSLIISITMLISLTPQAQALAKQYPTPNPVRYSTDPEDIIAFCSGSISNGSGYLNCLLTSGNFYATIQASTANNGSVTGSVECSVEFPDGSLHYLGTIPASNGSTIPLNVHICPYGNYRFIYETNFTDEIDVQGFIFD